VTAQPLQVELPAELVEAVAHRVAEIVRTTSKTGPSPWLDRKQAAEYLAVPLSRLEKDRTVPCHRWEGRVLYHRDELDAYVLGFGCA
jgi:hypothetical protein